MASDREFRQCSILFLFDDCPINPILHRSSLLRRHEAKLEFPMRPILYKSSLQRTAKYETTSSKLARPLDSWETRVSHEPNPVQIEPAAHYIVIRNQTLQSRSTGGLMGTSTFP